MKDLIEEIVIHSEALPVSIQQEVLDFIRFKENKLISDQSKALEVSLLSEAALSDWNNDEEDRAWKEYQ